MVVAAYSFLDVMWSMMVFFLWIVWIWILFAVFTDIFRRHDISGLAKTGWIVFTIVLPYLGVFVYLISQSDGMTQRSDEHTRKQMMGFERAEAGRLAAGGASAEIERGKQL